MRMEPNAKTVRPTSCRTTPRRAIFLFAMWQQEAALQAAGFPFPEGVVSPLKCVTQLQACAQFNPWPPSSFAVHLIRRFFCKVHIGGDPRDAVIEHSQRCDLGQCAMLHCSIDHGQRCDLGQCAMLHCSIDHGHAAGSAHNDGASI